MVRILSYTLPVILKSVTAMQSVHRPSNSDAHVETTSSREQRLGNMGFPAVGPQSAGASSLTEVQREASSGTSHSVPRRRPELKVQIPLFNDVCFCQNRQFFPKKANMSGKKWEKSSALIHLSFRSCAQTPCSFPQPEDFLRIIDRVTLKM